MKGWRTACWTLVLLGIPTTGRAEFDQCRLIDQVLNRLGNAMAINRLIIAKAMTARLSLQRVKLSPNRTRATGAPSANAPTRQSRLRWLATGLTAWLTPGKLVER